MLKVGSMFVNNLSLQLPKYTCKHCIHCFSLSNSYVCKNMQKREISCGYHNGFSLTHWGSMMHRYTSLVHIMACHLFGNKPLYDTNPELSIVDCWSTSIPHPDRKNLNDPCDLEGSSTYVKLKPENWKNPIWLPDGYFESDIAENR